jgi:hypothetical protein
MDVTTLRRQMDKYRRINIVVGETDCTERRLNFHAGENVSIEAEQDDETGEIDITFSSTDKDEAPMTRLRVNSGETSITQPQVNVIPGDNVSVEAAEDEENEEIDLTITAAMQVRPDGGESTLSGPAINVLAGDNMAVSAEVNEETDEVDLTLDAAMQVRPDGGESTLSGPAINVLAGSNIVVEAEINAETDEIDLTISAELEGGGNAIVQVQRTTITAMDDSTTPIPVDDSIPQITEGEELITVTITPTSATNLLHVSFDGFFCSTCPQGYAIALFRDAVADALKGLPFGSLLASSLMPSSFDYWMVAGTTDPITFRIRYGPAAGPNTAYALSNFGVAVFPGAVTANLSVEEVTV